MSRSMEIEFEQLGINVERTKNHIKLHIGGKVFIAPSTASDLRSGLNLASVICREIKLEDT